MMTTPSDIKQEHFGMMKAAWRLTLRVLMNPGITMEQQLENFACPGD